MQEIKYKGEKMVKQRRMEYMEKKKQISRKKKRILSFGQALMTEKV